MSHIWVALLALGFQQEDPAALVRQLSDDLIEVREGAVEKLIRMGESAREAVSKAATSENQEVRRRADEILKILNLYRDLRQWLAPPSRVSMSGEFTLEAACRELERQSGQKIAGGDWPPGTFKIELKNATAWEALEAICAASGKRTPQISSTAVGVGGSSYVRYPSSLSGQFMLRVGHLNRERTVAFSSGSEERSLSMGLMLSWERTTVPVRSFMDVEKAVDDQGFDLVPGFREYESRVHAGGTFAVEDPKPAIGEGYHLATRNPPGPAATAVRSLTGRIVLWIRAAPGDLELQMPKRVEASVAGIKVLDRDLKPQSEIRVSLTGGAVTENHLYAGLTFEGADSRMLKWNSTLWFAVDEKGRKYPGMASQTQESTARYTVRFGPLPTDAEVSKIVIRIPPRVLQMEVPFAFSDIPLK